jgi:hypothetical protein
MQQIAAADAKPQPATEMDKILAMRQMAAQKKQADLVYAQRARRQAAYAQAQLKSVK